MCVMTSTASVELEYSPSPSLPCSTGAENTTCLPPDSNTPLESSLLLATLIPSLIVAFYIIIIILTLFIWRFLPFSTLTTRWARYCRRQLTYYKNKSNKGYVHVRDSEEDGLGNYADAVELGDLERLHSTSSSGPSISLFDTDEQMDRGRSKSNDVGRNSVDLSGYISPQTGQLKDYISNPTETKVDRMCATPPTGYQTGSWRERVERMVDKKILQIQSWLDGGSWNGLDVVTSRTEKRGDDRLRHNDANGSGNGEECGEIRRLLLKYAEEEDEDADEFELHRFGSERGLDSPLRT